MRDESYSIFSGNAIISIPNTCLRTKLMTTFMSSERVPQLNLSSSCVQWGRDLKEGRLWGKWLPHAEAQIHRHNICLYGGLYQTVGYIPHPFTSHINTSSGIFHRSVPREMVQFHAVITKHCSSSSVFNVQWHQWIQAYDKSHQHCISGIKPKKTVSAGNQNILILGNQKLRNSTHSQYWQCFSPKIWD